MPLNNASIDLGGNESLQVLGEQPTYFLVSQPQRAKSFCLGLFKTRNPNLQPRYLSFGIRLENLLIFKCYLLLRVKMINISFIR